MYSLTQRCIGHHVLYSLTQRFIGHHVLYSLTLCFPRKRRVKDNWKYIWKFPNIFCWILQVERKVLCPDHWLPSVLQKVQIKHLSNGILLFQGWYLHYQSPWSLSFKVGTYIITVPSPCPLRLVCTLSKSLILVLQVWYLHNQSPWSLSFKVVTYISRFLIRLLQSWHLYNQGSWFFSFKGTVSREKFSNWDCEGLG